MHIEPGASALALSFGTFFYCIGSGFIPVMHAELYLLSVSAMLPPRLIVPVILLATTGQMVAKCLMYLAGRGAVRLPSKRVQRAMQRAHRTLEDRREVGGLFVFLSAASGFPPFYVISVACGMVAFDFRSFAVAGYAGRLVRFSAVVLFPQLVRGVL